MSGPGRPGRFLHVTTLRVIALRVALALLVGAAVIVVDAAAAPRSAVTAAAKKITPTGVGKVKLGETYTHLRAQHLVGKIRKGCQLAGPNARSAPLSAPLTGNVDFTMNSRTPFARPLISASEAVRPPAA
jgi:hypothetical protein